jgi:hypothetical protein
MWCGADKVQRIFGMADGDPTDTWDGGWDPSAQSGESTVS